MASTTAPQSSAPYRPDGGDPRRRLLAAVAALRDASRRADAARDLATVLGADDLLVFLHDPQVNAYLPAPGFPRTLPDADAWQQFLRRCAVERAAEADLPDPAGARAVRARGTCAGDGAIAVLLGGRPDARLVADLWLLMPLLVSAFRGEVNALAADGHAAVARETALQANLLATSLDEVRRALQRALSDAKGANAAKDHFLAVLSHELRTPLTPVLFTVSLLESDPRLPADLLADIQSIGRNVELEVKLIDDLLDLNRVARGQLVLHRAPCSIHRLLEQTLEMYRGEVHQKRIDLRVDLAAARDRTAGDPARLQQIFWNVIKNAVKFTPHDGRITVRTEGGAGAAHDAIAIRVTDSGIGIDPAQLPRLFNPFAQADSTIAPRFGGLGLGLSLSRSLAELHGGSISASSPGLGRGATFEITLPLRPADADEPAAPVPRPDAAREARHLKILLVEDHELTAHMMARLLRTFGHEVRTANSVGDAQRSAAAESFDLLISDVGLPDGTGLELMRDLARRYAIRGIALTGYGMEDDVRRSAEAGFAEHLTKPIDPSRLRAAIDRLA